MPSAALEALLEELSSGDDRRAEAAVGPLASLGAEAIPALRARLAAPQAEARWWAVRTLAEIEDGRVPALLRRALQDADAAVRHCAALALRRRPAPQAAPELVEALASPDRLLARLAADALVAAGPPAVPALLQALQGGPPAARLEAVRALARIGDPRSIPALFEALDEPSALMEYWAGEGLERMGVGMAFFQP